MKLKSTGQTVEYAGVYEDNGALTYLGVFLPAPRKGRPKTVATRPQNHLQFVRKDRLVFDDKGKELVYIENHIARIKDQKRRAAESSDDLSTKAEKKHRSNKKRGKFNTKPRRRKNEEK